MGPQTYNERFFSPHIRDLIIKKTKRKAEFELSEAFSAFNLQTWKEAGGIVIAALGLRGRLSLINAICIYQEFVGGRENSPPTREQDVGPFSIRSPVNKQGIAERTILTARELPGPAAFSLRTTAKPPFAPAWSPQGFGDKR